MRLAVSRLPATDSSKRRGVVLVNPGGPGEPGLDLPSALGSLLPADVSAGYDLIGFDPRGAGHSSPISCGLTPVEVLIQLPFPGPRGSILRNVSYAKSVAKRCADRVGPELQFLTTADNARDMNQIRIALNESKISYYGISAGTYLGAVYSSLFPDHIDHMVLDSAADPARTWYRQWQPFGRGMADRFPDLAQFAAVHHADVNFGDTASEVRATYLRLARQLDNEPIPIAQAIAALDGNVFRTVTFNGSFQDAALPQLMQIWAAARKVAAGSASSDQIALIRNVINSLNTGDPGVPVDNALAVAYANVCDDVKWNPNADYYADKVTIDRVQYPLTAGMPSNIWPCAYWKYAPIAPKVVVKASAANNILILQNLRDPPLHSGPPWA